MVILVDEEDRENEGDLVMAAEHITADAVNFMAKHGRGLICLTLTEARCKKLGLVQMARNNKTQYGTAFTVSIEAAEGVTTGISAADRALTMQVAVAKNTTADDIVQPGHVFPITAREGGVLVRAGHTEAGCDLAGMAGLEPSSVICEIMNDDGTMARLPELMEFAKEHGLKIGTIADLIHYRAGSETLIERVTSKTVATAHGDFEMHAYVDRASGATHLALVRGKPASHVGQARFFGNRGCAQAPQNAVACVHDASPGVVRCHRKLAMCSPAVRAYCGVPDRPVWRRAR